MKVPDVQCSAKPLLRCWFSMGGVRFQWYNAYEPLELTFVFSIVQCIYEPLESKINVLDCSPSRSTVYHQIRNSELTYFLH
jgi:hypothetical protein